MQFEAFRQREQLHIFPPFQIIILPRTTVFSILMRCREQKECSTSGGGCALPSYFATFHNNDEGCRTAFSSKCLAIPGFHRNKAKQSTFTDIDGLKVIFFLLWQFQEMLLLQPASTHFIALSGSWFGHRGKFGISF